MLNTDFNFSQQLPPQYIDLFAYGLTCVAWYYQNIDVVFKYSISNDNYTHVTVCDCKCKGVDKLSNVQLCLNKSLFTLGLFVGQGIT